MNVNRVGKQISEEFLTLFVTGHGRGPGREREQGQKADFRRNSDPVYDQPWSGGLVMNGVRVRKQITEEILTLFVTGRGRGLVVNVNWVGKQISEEILTLFVTDRGRGAWS